MRLSVAALAMLVAVAGALPPPSPPYNILMPIVFSSRSHLNVFGAIAKALAQRGHKVTLLSGFDLSAAVDHPNILLLRHTAFSVEDLIGGMGGMVMKNTTDNSKMWAHYKLYLEEMANNTYQDPVISDLYKRRDEFDCIIMQQSYNEVVFAFGHEKPLITVSAGGSFEPHLSATMGNFLNPAYASDRHTYFEPPYSFLKRIKNIMNSYTKPLYVKKLFADIAQEGMNRNMPDLPSLDSIERNQSFNFVNTHRILSTVMPLLPNQIEIGGIHVQQAKPLPENLEKFVSGETPVIYFSLGSVAQGFAMPDELRENVINAFKGLPYKVVWKFEKEIPNLPDNILVQKWTPQNDLLGHAKVQLFMSHCGLLSSQEAIYHGKPILCLPLFGDQFRNGKMLEGLGMSRTVLHEETSEAELEASLVEMMENRGYTERATVASRQMTDQITTPAERAVYWTEYAIRHKGAHHLRSPERDLSWIQLLHLDIIVMIILLLLVIVYIITKTVLYICSFIFCRRATKVKSD